MKVKINLGGGARMDEDGNVVPGKMIDMVVDGDHVYIVSLSNYCRGARLALALDTDVILLF